MSKKNRSLIRLLSTMLCFVLIFLMLSSPVLAANSSASEILDKFKFMKLENMPDFLKDGLTRLGNAVKIANTENENESLLTLVN